MSRVPELAGKMAVTAVFLGIAAFFGGGAAFLARPVGAAYIVLLTVWFVATAAGRSVGAPSGYRQQKLVLAVMAICSFPAILVLEPWEYAAFRGPIPRDGVIAWAGLALLAAAVALSAWAMWTLRGMFTARLGVQPGHRLVTEGPYRLVRHPAYLGNFLGLLGTALALGSVIGLVLTAVFVPAILQRIRGEEAMLLAEFGDAYRAYMGRTRRLFPGVY